MSNPVYALQRIRAFMLGYMCGNKQSHSYGEKNQFDKAEPELHAAWKEGYSDGYDDMDYHHKTRDLHGRWFGKRCQEEGVPYSMNPYQEDTQLHTKWCHGWAKSAQDELKALKKAGKQDE